MQKLLIIAIVLVTAASAVWFVGIRTNNSEPPSTIDSSSESPADTGKMPSANEVPSNSDNVDSAPQLAESEDFEKEPVDVRNWRLERGYYHGWTNDDGSKHPYEFYDIETLTELADADDGLAQFMLGEKLSFGNGADGKKKAAEYYWKSAVNGYTAGLTSFATDNFQASRPSDNGNISTVFIERLKYYAAAERLGDFVATTLITGELESLNLELTQYDRTNICEMGKQLANQIIAERIQKWGSDTVGNQTEIEAEIPKSYCPKTNY